MPDDRRFTLRLAKEDFKFSAAHFTLFADREPEPLHGHNYRVAVTLAGCALDRCGLLFDADRVKRRVRALCSRLDDRVLLPAEAPDVEIGRAGEALEVACAGRCYRFPAAEVELLPLANTSMELLARWFWRELAQELGGAAIESLAVSVEESSGQACGYEGSLSPAADEA